MGKTGSDISFQNYFRLFNLKHITVPPGQMVLPPLRLFAFRFGKNGVTAENICKEMKMPAPSGGTSEASLLFQHYNSIWTVIQNISENNFKILFRRIYLIPHKQTVQTDQITVRISDNFPNA